MNEENSFCPECNSTNIFYFDTKFECDDCGFRWNKNPVKRNQYQVNRDKTLLKVNNEYVTRILKSCYLTDVTTQDRSQIIDIIKTAVKMQGNPTTIATAICDFFGISRRDNRSEIRKILIEVLPLKQS